MSMFVVVSTRVTYKVTVFMVMNWDAHAYS
jgi:hypothetical protein